MGYSKQFHGHMARPVGDAKLHCSHIGNDLPANFEIPIAKQSPETSVSFCLRHVGYSHHVGDGGACHYMLQLKKRIARHNESLNSQ